MEGSLAPKVLLLTWISKRYSYDPCESFNEADNFDVGLLFPINSSI